MGSTLGEVSKNPNAQITISHRRAANGSGHQTRTSFALEYGILERLFMLDCYQEVLRPGGTCPQHCLYHNALRRILVCRNDQFLLRVL